MTGVLRGTSTWLARQKPDDRCGHASRERAGNDRLERKFDDLVAPGRHKRTDRADHHADRPHTKNISRINIIELFTILFNIKKITSKLIHGALLNKSTANIPFLWINPLFLLDSKLRIP